MKKYFAADGPYCKIPCNKFSPLHSHKWFTSLVSAPRPGQTMHIGSLYNIERYMFDDLFWLIDLGTKVHQQPVRSLCVLSATLSKKLKYQTDGSRGLGR